MICTDDNGTDKIELKKEDISKLVNAVIGFHRLSSGTCWHCDARYDEHKDGCPARLAQELKELLKSKDDREDVEIVGMTRFMGNGWKWWVNVSQTKKSKINTGADGYRTNMAGTGLWRIGWADTDTMLKGIKEFTLAGLDEEQVMVKLEDYFVNKERE